jgi:hypothetical protein
MTGAAVPVAMGLVLAQDPAQEGLVPDEGPVEYFAAGYADPPFGYRVHPGRPVRIPAPARTASNAAA